MNSIEFEVIPDKIQTSWSEDIGYVTFLQINYCYFGKEANIIYLFDTRKQEDINKLNNFLENYKQNKPIKIKIEF